MRLPILKLFHRLGKLNVNQISTELKLSQSTVATNIQVLEDAGLISTERIRAKKGQQKVRSVRFDEIVLRFETSEAKPKSNLVEVSMPLGLFTNCEVRAPCGQCSTEGIVGLLDVPNAFLGPSRVLRPRYCGSGVALPDINLQIITRT